MSGYSDKARDTFLLLNLGLTPASFLYDFERQAGVVGLLSEADSIHPGKFSSGILQRDQSEVVFMGV